MSAIYILWLRQLKRYFRARIRIISSLGQPVLFLISLGFGFGPLYQRAGAGNYLQYLAPGVIAMGILFPGVFSGIEIIWDRQFGFLKETLVAPVSRFQIVLGTVVQLPSHRKEDYFAAMKRSRQHNLKNKLKRSRERVALSVEIVQHPDAKTLDDIFGLFWQTYEKSASKFEQLNRKFFEVFAEKQATLFIILREKVTA